MQGEMKARSASVTILFGLLALNVALVGFFFMGSDRGDFSYDESQFTIHVDTVSTLYPHEHTIGDSLFDADHHVRVLSDVVTPQEDLWITSFELVVRNAPPQTLHHAGILIPNQANQTCPNAVYGREVYAASTADVGKPIAFQDPYAVFIPKGTPLILEVLYHNPFPPFGPGEIYTDVSASVVMNLRDNDSPLPARPVEYYRVHIEDTPCPGVVDEEVFVVPAGAEGFVKKSTENEGLNPSAYTFSRSGTIVYTGAHFHPWEGQERLDVFLNNKEVTTFVPERASSDPWSWVIPHSQTSLSVDAGDVLSLSAINSNPGPVPIVGAMGMVIFYFAPDE